jgi:acyl-CoA oxidase
LDAVDAWDLNCPDAIRVSEAHCYYVLVNNFVKAVEGVGEEQAQLTPPLRSCCNLFALWWMQEDLGDFLEGGYLDAAQAGMLRAAVREQLGVVRQDAVPLVDAWGHSDHALKSALGRYDGQVYEALLASAQAGANPVNTGTVDRAFAESLKPMRRSRL